jgi:hypothetical protein
MANAFTKQEAVMFDDMIAGFDDLLVIGKAAELYDHGQSPEAMQRAGDTFWIPAPMISTSYTGFDQTANFGDTTELSVPVSIGYHYSVPVKYTAKDLRNTSAVNKKGVAAKQKLSSDVNAALFNTVALQGANFIKRTTAPTGFDDIALADAALTEIGVPLADRKFFLSPRTANAMAGNLASRAEDTVRSRTAYEQALIRSDVAGFEVFKNDQSIRLTAATAGVTTVNGANQYLVPKAISTAGTGEISNYDNRYSDLVVTAAVYANAKVGDAFTIAGVNSVHLVTKADTGQLQTYRIVAKPAANTFRVYPAIISGTGGTRPELEYKNCTAAPANGAAITWLNTVAADMSPFFLKSALLLVPGSYSVEASDGWLVMSATTDLGVKITYTRQGEVNDLTVKARWDIDFGTSLTNPQMAGVAMFNQV